MRKSKEMLKEIQKSEISRKLRKKKIHKLKKQSFQQCKRKQTFFEIGDGDEVSKKLRQSKSVCKETCEIYLNRDGVN